MRSPRPTDARPIDARRIKNPAKRRCLVALLISRPAFVALSTLLLVIGQHTYLPQQESLWAQEARGEKNSAAPRLALTYLDETNSRKRLLDAELFTFERRLLERHAANDFQGEIYSIVFGRPADFVSRANFVESPLQFVLEVRGENCRLQVHEPTFVLSEQECTVSRESLRRELEELASFQIDALADYVPQSTGGNCAVVNHLSGQNGVRVTILNPPQPGEPSLAKDPRVAIYSRLFDCFLSLAKHRDLTMRYRLPAPIPGFRVLHDRRRSGPAESTWIQNSRMGVIVRQAYRKRVALAWEEERLQPYPDLPLTDDFGDERPVSPRIDLKVVSPDGRWSLAKNADDQLTITDQNRNASVLAPPSLVSAHPLAYLDAQRAFLLIRSRWNLRGDVDWQFEIFDPSTSRIKALALVDDDVQWWLSAVSRPRQPVSNSQTLYWGAIPQPRSKTTQFGQFDVAKMRWVRLTWIPGIQFQTRDLLVDEVRKKACVVHEGNVVSFDLPSWEYDRDAHP